MSNAPSSLDRASARARARAAQISAGVLAGGLAAVTFLGVPWTSAADTTVDMPEVALDTGASSEQASSEPEYTPDLSMVAEMLGGTKNAPQPPEPEAEDEPQEIVTQPIQPVTQPTTAPAPSALQNVRFLGRLRDPRTTRALVVINDKQRLAKAGDEIEGYTLDQVHEDRIVLSRNGRSEEIGRAVPNRTQEVVAQAPAPAKPQIDPNAARTRLTRQQLDDMTIEEREEYRQRLLQERQDRIQAMRERAQQENRTGQTTDRRRD